jgi:hypothetical protein
LSCKAEKLCLRRAGKTHTGRQLSGKGGNVQCLFRDRHHEVYAFCLDDGQQFALVSARIGCRGCHLKGFGHRS